MSSIRDLLNRARWRDGDLHALEIRVLHRGAPGDERVILGSRIQAAKANGIELTPENDESDSIFVPYHRFLSMVGGDGNVLWSKEGGMAVVTNEADSTNASTPAESPATEIVSEIDVLLNDGKPLVIDGSAGEGGGQLLRTSLTLSMMTGTPFVLEKIRAGRKKPGLMRQHLTCVKAAAAICGAEIEGASVGSHRLVFRPGAIVPGEHVLDIGSAGACALVLQTIALPLAAAKEASRIIVRGGTHAKWAPPFPFLEHAWLPLMRRAGANISLELKSAGFYPAGGGEVVLRAEPTPDHAWKPLHLGEASGVLAKLELKAIVSSLSEAIARRELTAAAALLKDLPLDMASESVRSPGPGNAIWLVARDEITGLTNVFSGIGDVGVKAEDIGEAVAQDFLKWQNTGAAVEEHLSDQVMLPIALAGAGSYTCSELSLHLRTNLEVIRAFTGHRIKMWDLGQSRYRMTL
jgi:RNA 3'-terminal phosphate cyclase (ATP)